MKNTSLQYGLTIVILIAFTLYYFTLFQNTPYYQSLESWAFAHPFELYFILFVIKVLGILWPPLPGGYFNFIALPIYGWFVAYTIDFFGGLVGASLTYYIARKWGRTFLKHIFSDTLLEKISSLHIKPGKEIESIVFFRFTASGFAEFVCYGAGLLKLNFTRYIIGTALSHLLVGIPLYYFADLLLIDRNFLISIPLFIVGAIMIFLFKDRYIGITQET